MVVEGLRAANALCGKATSVVVMVTIIATFMALILDAYTGLAKKRHQRMVQILHVGDLRQGL